MGNHSDLITIGKPHLALDKLEHSEFSEDQIYRGKIFFVELSPDSLEIVSKINPSSFTNCRYVFYQFNNQKLETWFDTFNRLSPVKIIDSSQSDIRGLISDLIRSIRDYDQNQAFLNLITTQEERIKEDKQKSEEEHRKKETNLLRARQRALQAKKNEQSALTGIEVIFNSESIPEIEERLTDLLNKNLGIIWVRVLSSPTDVLTDLPIIKYQTQFTSLVHSIDIDTSLQGKVVYAKNKKQKFKKDEESTLQIVSDAIALRVQMIAEEEKIQDVRKQWTSTFNAIPFKAALISRNYEIMKTGGSFKEPQVEGEKCYEKFWNKTSPCENCSLGKDFLIEYLNESLEVNSKRIFDPTTEEYFYLNFYRDFETSKLPESGGFAKSKLEELGIICGSIAHELNNPLGGIKILLDLLKSDEQMNSQTDAEDLKILSDSTERCIQTVRELLEFTRSKSKTQNLSQTFQQISIFTRAFLLSLGHELQIEDPRQSLDNIYVESSYLIIRVLEMVVEFSKNLHEARLEYRMIFLSTSIKDQTLTIELNVAPSSESNDLATAEKISLILDTCTSREGDLASALDFKFA